MSQLSCAMIAVVGAPNAGKSTLVNQLAGGKVSIVTPKVQTTRFNVRGVCAEGGAQLIFVDTPGIFDAPKKFEKAMVDAAWSGIADADAVLLLIDAKNGLREEGRELIARLKRLKKPVLLALNKIDLVEKEALLKLAKACDESGAFERIFMISALKNKGVDDVRKYLANVAPEGAWLYPEDQMSDISLRLLAAEVTREKLFLKLDQELPYALFVETEKWDEKKDAVAISQIILVQREGQKKIVIGEKGEKIKQIGISARRDMEKLLGKRVHLNLFVKVNPNWKDTPEHYRLLGLEFKKS